MQNFDVVFAPTAYSDLDEILRWLSERAPEKIPEWLAALQEKIGTLGMMPERCPYAPENGLWGTEELRQLLFQEYPSKYRVIFTVSNDRVRILNIRHGARRFLHETETDPG